MIQLSKEIIFGSSIEEEEEGARGNQIDEQVVHQNHGDHKHSHEHSHNHSHILSLG